MEREYIKKIHCIQIVIVVALLTIYSLCGYLIMGVQELDDGQASIDTAVEEMLKEDIYDGLKQIQIGLTKAINNGSISLSSDKDISEWVMDHNSFKNSDKIKEFSLVNIGYSISDLDEIKEVVNSSDKIPDELKELICNDFNKIDLNDTDTLIQIIGEKSIEYSKAYDISLNTIKDILFDAIFENNKTLFSTTNSIDVDEGDIIWIESITIPSGSIGFNDEPSIENDQPNYSYKKLVVSVSVDSTTLMKSYNIQTASINSLVDIISNIVIFIMVATTVLCFSVAMIFIYKINKEL